MDYTYLAAEAGNSRGNLKLQCSQEFCRGLLPGASYLFNKELEGILASPTMEWFPLFEKCQQESKSCLSTLSLHNFCRLMSNGAHLLNVLKEHSHEHYTCRQVASCQKYKLPKLMSIASYKTEYRKWSMKHRGAYFIFPVINAALIRERCLFQLRVKHWGEYREN